VLLAVARVLPRGVWWWRSAVLGTLNVGAFFLLVYVAAQLLPSSVAASVMALAPLALAGFAWLLVGEEVTAQVVAGAVAGIVGVLLLVGGASGSIDPAGVAASAAALLLSSAGAVLAKRWSDGTPLVAMTAWQLVLGGTVLTVLAAGVEGAPPALTASSAAGFAFTTLVATALAYLCWFAGLARLRAATVGVVGLLNPVTGVLLGALVAHETFTVEQVAGIVLVLTAILATSQARTRRIPVEPEPELAPVSTTDVRGLAPLPC
jgi:probable blue pigment (indigoidine) exporter